MPDPTTISGHRRFERDFSAYIDGQLSPLARHDLERHLAICPGCEAEVEELRAVKWAAGHLGNEQPDRSFAISPEMLNARPIAPPSGWSAPAISGTIPWQAFSWVAAGVVAFAIGAVVAYLVSSSGGDHSASQAPTTIIQSVAATPNVPAAATVESVATVPPTDTPAPLPSATTAPVVVAAAPAPRTAPVQPPASSPAIQVTPVGPSGQPGGVIEVPIPNRPGARPIAPQQPLQSPTTVASGTGFTVSAAPPAAAAISAQPATRATVASGALAAAQPPVGTVAAPAPPIVASAAAPTATPTSTPSAAVGAAPGLTTSNGAPSAPLAGGQNAGAAAQPLVPPSAPANRR